MTIEDLKQKCLNKEYGDYTSKNDKGENVVVHIAKNMFQLITYQSNGWTRINEYYYEDNIWTISEIYDK